MIGRLTQIKRPDRFADVVEIVRDRGLVFTSSLPVVVIESRGCVSGCGNETCL